MSRAASVAYQMPSSTTIVWPLTQPACIPTWASKAPEDSLDYTVDFGRWLKATGLSILSISVASSYGLSVSQASFNDARTTATVQIGSGVPDTTAYVKMLVSLTSGRTLDVSIALRVLPGLFTPVFDVGADPDASSTLDSFGNLRSADQSDFSED